jgi:pimeloyl-ACP methyl ester carboxylesterase
LHRTTTFTPPMALGSRNAAVRHYALADARTRRPEGPFKETPRTHWLRRAFGLLGRISPDAAARAALHLLATPPQAPVRDWQRRLRRSAVASRLPLAKGELAVYEWGTSGPLVLLVHGWGSHGMHLGRLVEPLLEEGYRVVAFDAPAHGASRGRTSDIAEYALAVAAVARNVGPVHTVVAHSFGAAATLLASREHGLEAEGLVLVSSFVDCTWYVEAFGKHLGLPPDQLTRLHRLVSRRHAGRVRWEELSLVEMLHRWPNPTLLIHDRHDPEIPCEHSVLLHAAASEARLHRTEGLGHHRLLGSPEVVDQVLHFAAALRDRA